MTKRDPRKPANAPWAGGTQPPAAAPTNDPMAALADLAARDPDTLTDAEIDARYAAAAAARNRAFKLVLLRHAETMLADMNGRLDSAGAERGGPDGEDGG
ncbi:hypothetical protein PMI01_04913 [Caulobacter sp. AP07]|uniref:hypothetical protein n=1 Tax=Caulobacter sp. AP07 TaxID=1144304 RepID=UPI000271F81C|nr:hypothetical protein [Caulobacter sp. AP07]EJL22948.1 hypothetical protein PMI01_04913 [Caulobacter sp. AP07]